MVGDRSGAQRETACAAPTSALYFRPDGAVTACCASWHVLGWVTGPSRQSLREIWTSPETALLRRALDRGDFGYGCWECGAAANAGRREESLAAAFDATARPVGAAYPAVLDFALSNRCNLRCVMCNGGLSSAIRSQREGRPPLAPAYDDRFFDELADFLPHVELASFKGGEPFLARENWRVWDMLAALGATPELAITTNGTIWNDRVAQLIAEQRASINVSIDAVDQALLREIRVGIDPDRLTANLDRFQAAVEASGTTLTLSFCLMAQNWWELPTFLAEASRRGANANVIWVDGPERFGLLRMPSADLSAAADALDRSAESTAGLPDGARAQVHEAAGKLRAASQRAHGGATPVEVRPKASGATAPPVDAIAALEAEAGERAMILTYHNNVVVELDVPPWANELGRIDWLGSGLEEFTTLLASGAGCPMRGRIEPAPEGRYGFKMVLERAGSPVTLVGCYVPGPLGQGTMAFLRSG